MQDIAAPSQPASAAPAAHVTLKAVLSFDEEDSQVRFDEAARRLVLIKHRCFVALPLNRKLLPITVESRGKVENVRFSLNHRFAAVQRSEHEIEFMDLLQSTSFCHTCKGSRGRWRILAYHWTGTPVADFLVVTTAGIEFYLVLPERACLRLVKSIAHSVSWCVYSHVTRLVLLATGPQDNVIHGIQIQPSTLVRIPKFEVALAPPAEPPVSSRASGQAKLRRSLLPGNLGVARLYDMIFCVHSETERQQVHLYQVSGQRTRARAGVPTRTHPRPHVRPRRPTTAPMPTPTPTSAHPRPRSPRPPTHSRPPHARALPSRRRLRGAVAEHAAASCAYGPSMPSSSRTLSCASTPSPSTRAQRASPSPTTCSSCTPSTRASH
jgi:hypothetical protein